LDGGGTGTTGAGNDLLFGNSDNDTLNGGTGDDLLIGGLGDDIINGGIGKDVMNGGGGNDIFLFNSLNELGLGTTRDVIADFTIGADKIDLSGIDAIAGGSDQAFTFVSTPFTMEGQVSYNAGIISINTDADTAAEYEIQLIGTPPATLSASDFIL
jgi:Ca2+-binding RTX toxin-like protein